MTEQQIGLMVLGAFGVGMVLGCALEAWRAARVDAERMELEQLRVRHAPPPVLHIEHVQLAGHLVFSWLNERGLMAVPQGKDWQPRARKGVSQ